MEAVLDSKSDQRIFSNQWMPDTDMGASQKFIQEVQGRNSSNTEGKQ